MVQHSLNKRQYKILLRWRNDIVNNPEKWSNHMSFIPQDRGCLLQRLAVVGFENTNQVVLAEYLESLKGKEKKDFFTVSEAVCGLTDSQYLGFWNDRPERTVDDCIRLLDEAVAVYAPQAHGVEDGNSKQEVSIS